MWRVPPLSLSSPPAYLKTPPISTFYRFKSTHSPKTSSTAARKIDSKIKVHHQTPSPPRTDFSAQPPPHIGPPRLIRYPPPPEATSFTHTKSSVSRLFAYYNTTTATNRRGLLHSNNSTATPSTSYLPKRKQALSTTEKETTMPQSADAASKATSDSLRSRSVKQADHEHSHSSSWVPHIHTHSHSHSHGAEGSAEEADRLLAALKGKGERSLI
jgi:hypothetical protein